MVEFEDMGTYALGAPDFLVSKDDTKVLDAVKEASEKGLRVVALAKMKGHIEDENTKLDKDLYSNNSSGKESAGSPSISTHNIFFLP